MAFVIIHSLKRNQFTSCRLGTLAEFKRILVIQNPVSGDRGSGYPDAVLSRLRAAGRTVALRRTERRGDAERFARDLAAAAFDLIVVAGGDGTINEVVNGIAGRSIPLGLIPVGTANVLAAELSYPDVADAVADLLLSGRTQRIYPGIVSGRRFVMMAGIGFDAHVVANIDPNLKGRIGKAAYVWQGVVEFLRYRPRVYRFGLDGREYTAAAAVIANGHYYAGRFVCAPEARLVEPLLHVCLFRHAGRRALLRYGVGLLCGRLHRLGDVAVVPATRIEVADTVGEPVQGDGDIIATLPAEFTVDTEGIDIISPR